MEVIIKRKNKIKEEEAIINEKKLRVVAYARVSTEQERQQGSFESQKSYYYEKITTNPDWIFKGIYADEGISGSSSENRSGFVNMIRDARKRKFDLILTKSISRFARNTIDTLKYVRLLKEKNIAVFFEEENINTNALQGELLITILGSLAQQEIENISSHILAGKQMALQNGTRSVGHKCYGYDYIKETKELKINKDAKNVKLIFELYDKYENTRIIIEELHKKGIKSPSGQEYWTTNGITVILKNEKYIGNVVFGTHYVYDSMNHRTKINKGEREKYRYVNHHEPIISKEFFEKVNKKYQNNITKKYNWHKKNQDIINMMAWKGSCGFCGYSLARKSSHEIKAPYYKCRRAVSIVTRDSCPNSRLIRQQEVENSFLKGMRKLKNKISLNTLNDDVEDKIGYIRNEIINEKFDKFKYELYEKLVRVVIMGGYETDGKANPYLIRFILKEDEMFDNKFKNRRHFTGKTKEVLSFDYKLDISYNSFDENRNYSKVNIESIKVMIEIEDDDSLIWKL